MNHAKTILIIDDEIDLVETLKDLLSQSGYRIFTAHNGLEGLERFAKCHPDLIILDINMPKMGGIAFFENILDSQKGIPPCPVLVLSARTNLESVFRAFDVDFIPKPFQFGELLERIEKLLEKTSEAVEIPSEDIHDSRLKILLIENDDQMVRRLFTLFHQMKYRLITATTGLEGIKKASAHLPDLILIQMNLRDTPGDVIALKLKMLPKITDVPIILYSSKEPVHSNYEGAGRIYEKLNVKILSNIQDPAVLFDQSSALLQKAA